MKSSVGTWVSALAILGMAVPVRALDVPVPSSKMPAHVTDVVLTSEAQLSGIVVGKDGRPAALMPVEVLHNQTVVARVRTDARGRYTVQGLRPGVHAVRTVNGQKTCRFWSAATAPPAARRGLVLITDDTVIRGQNYCDDGCGQGCGEGCGEACGGGWSAGTWAGIGLFAGAVVAVAVSVDNNDAPIQQPPPASP